MAYFIVPFLLSALIYALVFARSSGYTDHTLGPTRSERFKETALGIFYLALAILAIGIANLVLPTPANAGVLKDAYWPTTPMHVYQHNDNSGRTGYRLDAPGSVCAPIPELASLFVARHFQPVPVGGLTDEATGKLVGDAVLGLSSIPVNGADHFYAEIWVRQADGVSYCFLGLVEDEPGLHA